MRTTRTHVSILIVLFAALSLTSCTSSRQLVEQPLSQKVSSKPAFLDGVELASTSKNLAITTRSLRSSAPATSAAGTGLLDGISGKIQQQYASIMNVMPGLITNVNLYKCIDEWYGTKYRYGGTDKSGIDCSAFVMKVYENVFGLNLLRTAAEQFGASNFVWNVNELREGDLVFFKIKTKNISHVGIYLINHFFVHASSSQGVMISSLDDKYWQRYFAGAGRVL